MNINELIEQLQEIAEVSPNAEVRYAAQPNWPMEYSIGEELSLVDKGSSAVGDEDVVYISERNQIGYLDGEASDAIGW
jgi:hypothetical protein